MGSTNEEYSVDDEIAQFFEKTSASRSECDARAKELVGGNVNAVVVQGVCSYSVYAGPKDEFVVQFRLKSLELRAETVTLARDIYGPLVPTTTFKGQIGEDFDTKEPLYVYVMTRVQGISHLDFILAHNVPENAREWFAWRKNLIADVARYVWLYSPSSLMLILCYVGSLLSHGRPHSIPTKLAAMTFAIDMRKIYGCCCPRCRSASATSSNTLSRCSPQFSLSQWYSSMKTLEPVTLW